MYKFRYPIVFFALLVISFSVFADVKSKKSDKKFKEIEASEVLLNAIRQGGYVLLW